MDARIVLALDLPTLPYMRRRTIIAAIGGLVVCLLTLVWWGAIVVMHTWENWEPQPDAKAFLERTHLDKVIVLTTSADGDKKMERIAAITAASEMDEVPAQVARLGEEVDALLAHRATDTP